MVRISPISPYEAINVASSRTSITVGTFPVSENFINFLKWSRLVDRTALQPKPLAIVRKSGAWRLTPYMVKVTVKRMSENTDVFFMLKPPFQIVVFVYQGGLI